MSKPRQADGTEAGLASHTKRMLDKIFFEDISEIESKKGKFPSAKNQKGTPNEHGEQNPD